MTDGDRLTLILQSLIDSAQLDQQRGQLHSAEEKYRIALEQARQHRRVEDSPAYAYAKFLSQHDRLDEALQVLRELQRSAQAEIRRVQYLVGYKSYTVLLDILPGPHQHCCHLIQEMYAFLCAEEDDSNLVRQQGRRRLEAVKAEEAQAFLRDPDPARIEALKASLGNLAV